MSEKDIEQEIQAKCLTAPHITPQHIQSVIVAENYFTAADGVLGAYKSNGDVYIGTQPGDETSASHPLLTFCVLVLRNGFTVTGESACASPENFDAEIGRKIARENAVNKIWMLEGYLLKQNLSNGKSRAQQAEYVNRAVVEGHTPYYGLKDANWLSDDCLKIEYELAQAYYEPAPGEKAPRRDLGE
ncbi:hypothetical protein CBJ87_003702 [Salmonella enterica subsp. enterica serovar Fresno]|nr:hypothetical protein [Salmonella enterica subsp. enterica serovar Liverpool]EDQ0200685.1 hypothetical protein [Salmonella enterica subsp. enterica serovar Fresno]